MQTLRRFSVAFVGLLLIASAARAQAPLMPEAFPQYLSSTGAPLAGGTLTFDAAGTTTPQAVYSDATLSTPLANPYTLDSTGRPPLGIYLSAVAYKIILKDASGVTIRTQDNVYGATYLASLAVAPSVQTTTSTGTVNDFATASITSNLVVVRCNNAADLTLTGFTAATTAGQQLLILSVGAGNVFLPHQNTGSAAANRAINFATSGNTPLAAGVGLAKYVYDTTTSRWRLTVHEQGTWITRTFAAGNYTASAGTWTVASATRDAYLLKGRSLTFSVTVTGTTSGAPVTVKVALPTAGTSAFTAAASDFTTYYVQGNGSGGAEGGYANVTAASTVVNYQRFANTAFGAGTVTVDGVFTFEIQ